MKKVEYNSHETHNIYPNLNAITLNDERQFRLNKIYETKDYLVAEVKEKELIKKKLSKYSAFLIRLISH